MNFTRRLCLLDISLSLFCFGCDQRTAMEQARDEGERLTKAYIEISASYGDCNRLRMSDDQAQPSSGMLKPTLHFPQNIRKDVPAKCRDPISIPWIEMVLFEQFVTIGDCFFWLPDAKATPNCSVSTNVITPSVGEILDVTLSNGLENGDARR